jgi:hypothetical protein
VLLLCRLCRLGKCLTCASALFLGFDLVGVYCFVYAVSCILCAMYCGCDALYMLCLCLYAWEICVVYVMPVLLSVLLCLYMYV